MACRYVFTEEEIQELTSALKANKRKQVHEIALPFFGLFAETVRDHLEYAQHLFSRYGAVLGGQDALFDVGYLSRKQDNEKAVLFHALSARMSGRARQNLLDIPGPKDGWQCDDFHRRSGRSNGPDFYRVLPDRIVGIEHFAKEKGVRS